MDDISSVDELLKAKNLNADEFDQLKDLIEESRIREKRIREWSSQTRENLERLSQSFQEISERTDQMSHALGIMVEQAEAMYLKLLPKEGFYLE